MTRRADRQPTRTEQPPSAGPQPADRPGTRRAVATFGGSHRLDEGQHSPSRWTRTWRTALLVLSISPILRWMIIHHAVQAGFPWSSACAHCGQAIGPINWRPLLPTARCGHCHHRTGPPPWLVEGVVIATAATLATAPLPDWIMPAYALWALLGVVLTFIDAAVHRLPDRLTWAASAGFLTLAVPTAVLGLVHAWLRAVEAAALLTTLLTICAMARPSWIGRGDAKYAAAIGAAAGWISWFSVYLAMVIATSLGAILGIGLITSRRASRHARIPLGPFLFAGTLLTIALVKM